MFTHILFIVLFALQVFLMSLWFPRKVMKRARHILDNYPPATHPKLYPKPVLSYERALVHFKWLVGITLAVGLFFMVALLGESNSEDWSGVVVGYFLVQFIPMMFLEIGSFKYYKMMRQVNTAKKRAELQPRRLFDIVSPTLVGFTVFLYFAFVGFILYMMQFDYPWFGGLINVATMTVANLLFIGIIYWNFRGKKFNPHQTHEDRRRQIAMTTNSLLFTSIAATLFITITILMSVFELRSWSSISMTLYLQVIGLLSLNSVLKSFKVEDINFDVYKDDPLTT